MTRNDAIAIQMKYLTQSINIKIDELNKLMLEFLSNHLEEEADQNLTPSNFIANNLNPSSRLSSGYLQGSQKGKVKPKV